MLGYKLDLNSTNVTLAPDHNSLQTGKADVCMYCKSYGRCYRDGQRADRKQKRRVQKDINIIYAGIIALATASSSWIEFPTYTCSVFSRRIPPIYSSNFIVPERIKKKRPIQS